MGDRGNVIIHEKTGGVVYLYTHWTGSELPATLASALHRGRDRWTDQSYLARIIFSEMVRGEEMNTTGFGISTKGNDSDRGMDLHVHTNFGIVVHGEHTFTFEEYIEKFKPKKSRT